METTTTTQSYNLIKVKKRTGKLEQLDINKIHFVVEEACDDLPGVSSSQIEMNANIQFYDGMTTKDIQNVLQTTSYNRFRFGVGSDFGKGQQVDYVLGKWDTDQQKAMPERLKISTDLIRSFIFAGAKNTMNQFNGK